MFLSFFGLEMQSIGIRRKEGREEEEMGDIDGAESYEEEVERQESR